MAEQDRGSSPGPATSILQNAFRLKTLFVLFFQCNLPEAGLEERTRRELAHCTCGVFSCGDWKNGFSKEAPELRLGKPSTRLGLPVDTERRIYMIKLLVELPLIGRFTIIIVWHRKGRR